MAINVPVGRTRWTRDIPREANRIATAARSNARVAELKQLASADAVRAEAFRIAEASTNPELVRQKALLRVQRAELEKERRIL